MDKKILIYGVVVLAVIAVAVTIVVYRQKPVGLSTGTPAQLSEGKSSSAEIEKDIEAKGGRGRRFVEDAG